MPQPRQDDDDRRLLADCLADKPGAWEAFVDRFAPYLAEVCRRGLLRLVRPAGPQEVNDLLQDILLDCLKKDRQALRAYQGRAGVLPFRRGNVFRAAAALLLVALGLGWILLGRQGSPAPERSSPAPPQAASLPEGPLGKGNAPSAYLAPGADLVLEAGASLTREGNLLHAAGGRLWLDLSRPEPLTLALPGGSLTFQDAEIALALPPVSKASWLLKETQAEDSPLAQVWVLRGEISLPHAGPGAKLLLDERGWHEEPTSPEELTRLREARLQALLSTPGLDAIGSARRDLPAAYRWISVLQGRERTTELELSLGLEDVWYRWVAGVAPIPPKPQETLELTWDGERLRAKVNGILHLSLDRAHLAKALHPAAKEGWAVSPLGGAVTVARSRLISGGGSD